MANDITMDDVKSFLKSRQALKEEEKTQDIVLQKEEPRLAALQGRVEFTPEMEQHEQQITKDVFPQPTDSPVDAAIKNLRFPLDAGVQGVESVPEALTNFGLGAAQTAANVPIPNRITYGDLIRKLNPSYVSPEEWNQAPTFQRELAQHPVQNALYNPAQFAGSFFAPIGGAEKALLGLASRGIKFLPGAIPAIEQGTRAVQLAQNALPARVLDAIHYAPKIPLIPAISRLGFKGTQVGPVLHGAAVGAAYGPIFAGGGQFGATRQLQQPSAIPQQMGAGAAIGAGAGAAANWLQRWLLERQIAKLAAGSQLAETPKQTPSLDAIPMPPDAPVLKSRMDTATDAVMGRYGGDVQKLRDFRNRYIPALKEKLGPESEEHSAVIERGAARIQKAITDQQKLAERRGYTENRQAEATQKTAEHTSTSGERFEDLSARINNAASREELEGMRNEIYNPGTGPKGQRLLDSGHQKELDRQWQLRDAYYNKFKQEGGLPGESEGTAKGSTTVPQAAEPVSGEGEQEPQGVREKPPAAPTLRTERTPVANFLQGAFRKIINKKNYGAREKRYQFAVSVNALADAAELPQDKKTALGKWVGDLSEARRELTYKNMQIEQLAEWAVKHESEWIGTQREVKARTTTDKKTQGDLVHILTQTGEERGFKKILLRARMEKSFEDKVEQNLEREQVNLEQYGRQGIGHRTSSKPHVEVTTNGTTKTGEWQENLDGSLEIQNIGKIIPAKFVPPKSADELFNQMHELLGWKDYFDQKLTNIRGSVGKYDYLGDGTTAANVMEEAFEKLKLDYINGKAPDTHVWHVDSTGHVSTVNFKQGRMAATIEEEAARRVTRLNEFLDEIKDKNGNINYDAVWGSKTRLNKLLTFVPGSETVILGMLMGKQLHKLGTEVGRATGTEALFAGTIDDIMRANSKFDGDGLSARMHGMFGEILANFFHDTSSSLHPINSAEDLAELLNEFKGTKGITRSSYRRRAIEVLDATTKKSGVPVTKDDIAEAYRKADTGLMIRQHYQRLAEEVGTRIDEMKIRRRDAQTGEVSKEGKKFLTPDDFDSQGRVKKSAYNSLYHAALEELHKGLRLEPGAYGVLGGAFDSAAMRKSQSIMANNPRVALKNFFDQAPLTLAYFGKHVFTAAADLARDSGLRESIERMPVIPQADMSRIKMEEALADVRKPENVSEQIAGLGSKFNNLLSTKLDPLFKGRAPLVSLADRQYAKISALASLYKQAALRGIDRHEFVNELMNGGFTKKEEGRIFGQMSKDLTVTLNSVAPGINKDLFASSTLGKATNQYSTPGRRAMKLQEGWWKSGVTTPEGRADKLRLVTSLAGLTALGGAGAIPISMQFAYRLYGAYASENEKVERNLQWFDQWNLLHHMAGIDYSTSFGPDYFTGAQPTLEGLEKVGSTAISAATKAHSNMELLKLGAGALLEGLSLIPKIGPVGFDDWKSGLKDIEAAQQGTKRVYFNHNGSLHSVDIPGYTYLDALRDWMVGGTSPKAYEAIRQSNIRSAQKSDAISRYNKSIIPERSDGGPNENPTAIPLGIMPEVKN